MALGGFSAGASAAVNDITRDTRASIEGARVEAGAVGVTATQNATIDALTIAGAGGGAISRGSGIAASLAAAGTGSENTITNTTVAEVMVRRVSTVQLHEHASELTGIFEKGEVALVVDSDRAPIGIITKMDLIEILTARRARA